MLATLVVDLYAAATVAPATARTHSHEATECDTSIFSALNSLDAASSAARGADAREPS